MRKRASNTVVNLALLAVGLASVDAATPLEKTGKIIRSI